MIRTFAADKNDTAMKNFFKLIVPLLVAASCSDGLSVPSGEWTDIEGNEVLHEMIVLGEQLDDPYSVENMTKALDRLYPTRSDRTPLEPTDLYVRFLPADEEEYEELEAAGLLLVDHPVDRDIVREGDYYHDPQIEEGKITWQYCVVDKDFEFPGHIKYELLDRCYIAEHDVSTKADGVDWAAVDREAFRLTGNEDMLVPQTRGSDGGTPAGRITIVDPAFSDEPFGVSGVRVSCNCFVRFAHAYTDKDGYYRMSRHFRSNPRYRLVFKNRLGFGIGLNLLLCPASFSTLGKHSPQGVDVEVSSESDRKLFTRCVVNNAAYDYYEKCRSGDSSIRTPPGNLRIWIFRNMSLSSAPMMQQGVLVDGSTVAKFLGEYSFLLKMFLPDILLGLKGAYDYEEIYSRTVHELAHASHFMQAGKDYWNRLVKYVMTSFVSSGFVQYGVGTGEDCGYCEVGEMWAYYVQTMLHNERYPDSGKLFGTCYWFSPQIFMYLDERGLTRYRIFSALTSDIAEREKLKKKLISLYPQFKSSINQAFSRYNY